MSESNTRKLGRIGRKMFQIFLCVLLAAQSIWFPTSAKAESSSFYFRGFSSENVTTNTFAYAISGATLDGTTVQMTSASGTAVGYIALDEDDHDISTSVDLGGLEISFSVVTAVTEEGTAGAENDVPTVEIYFCSEADPDAAIGSVTLQKPDPAVSGNATLSSHASIPHGTRGIFVFLTGTSVSGDNTVVFSSPSLKINDAAAPSCDISYNTDWTNGNVTVTVTAADEDSGLEGIYVNGTKVSDTSPYTTTATTSGTQYQAYSKDYAGKVSATVDKTVDNIDKVTPDTPTSAALSTEEWTNQDVTLNLPTLAWGSAAPEYFIYQIGTSAWQTLPEGFALTDSGRYTFRLAVQDAAGNTSGSVERYASIDKIVPTIDSITKEASTGSCRVDVTCSDGGLSELNLIRYAAGDVDAESVLASGTDIAEGTFTVYVGGQYTICVSDHAGNVARSLVTLSTKPTLTSIADTSTDEDTPLTVDLDVSDAETSLDALTIEATASDTDLIGSIDVIQSESAASLRINPAAEQHGGPVTITVTVTDADGEVATDQFTVTVNSVNDNPIAEDDTGFTLEEDTHIKIDVLANDTDLADGDTLSISAVDTPAHGTAVIVLGEIKYTPNENYVGEDSFSYTVSDGNGGTDTALVYVTVTNVNDAPTALPDEATCAEDSFVNIDVLANDTDIDVDSAVESISLLSCENGANGTAEVKDGQILYTPNANFYGDDSFTYTMEDSAHTTATATVTIKVSAVPDDPKFVGLDAEYTVDEDSVDAAITFSISDVETPADSLMLQASSPDTAVDLLPNENISVSGLGDDSDEVSVLVTPLANVNGDVTLTLTLGDGFTTITQTVIVHITDVNDAPTAKADSISYDEDAESVSIPLSALLGNDTDLDGDTLTFDGIVSTTTVGTLETVGDPVTGLIYTPLANYEGTDSFTYRVSDGTTTSTGTCTLTARAANDTPTIEFTETGYTVDEDTEITGIRVEIGDKETASASLLLIGGSDDTALVSADNITIVNNGDGTADISILPAADAYGTVNIIITVSDGAASAYASVPLTITPKPDAPVAAADNIYVPLSGKRVFSTLLNDHDVDGDSLTITGYDDSALNGTLLYDEETKLFTYYSAIGEVGTGTFTYTIWDGALTATGTVTLHINSVTHAPVISAISDQAIEEDHTISGISFLVEDEDYGDEITISVASSDDSILEVGETSAVVTDNGDGSYTLALKPVANASGTVTITVTATDKAGLTSSTSFTLRVLPQNDAPIAVADEITLNEDSTKALDLTGNDSDPDGDDFWVNYVSWPEHGYLLRSGTTYTYYPYYNWYGTETLSYQITDGRAYATSTVVLTIAPVNDAPVARDDYKTLANSTGAESAAINVLGNDYDPEGDTVYLLQIESQPVYGEVSFEGGVVTYTRTSVSPNDNGADSFTYRIIDRSSAEGDYLSAVATVHIGLVFHSSLYTYWESYYCLEDSAPADINLPIYNPNNVEYSLTLSSSSTALGELTIVDHDTVHFVPAADANGSVSVQYTVTQDGGSETSTNSLYIRVYPVNDPPVIDSAPASASCEEDSETGATFDVTFHDVDCALNSLYFYAYVTDAETSATVPFEVQTQVTRTETGATVTVIPLDNVNGTADLVIGVSDGLEAAERSIALTITPVDDAPGVNQLNATTYEDVPVKISVLRSNSELDGDTVSLAVLEGDGPEHGEVEILSGGIIVYHPDADFYGDDSFTYTLTDQTTAKLSSNQTASIHVVAVNDQPVIKDLDYYQTTNEDTSAEVLLTVHDVDNDLSSATHYTLTSDNEELVKSISIVHVSGEQMKITVVPNDNAYGTAIINIVASDGELTAEGAFQLKVVSVNDTPVAVDDAKTVEEAVSASTDTTPRKTTATMDLTANDTDVEDTTLKIVKIENVSYGTVVNNGNGTVTISANGDYSGTITFDYTVMDKNGASASANAVLTITPMNDPPNAVADSRTINEDNAISINVLSNDTDVENDTLSVLSFTDPAHGTVVTDDGSLLCTPETNYNGTDSFTYTVSDGHGGTDTATVSLKIKPVNDAPEIAKHSTTAGDWTMDEDSTASFNFVVSDPETQASNLLITIHSENASILLTSQIKLTTNAEGYKTITVRSNPDAYGLVPVHFLLSDGQLTTEATYNITINGVNDAPVADDQLQAMKEDGVLTSTLTATDIEDNDLTYSLETAPLHGTAEIDTDGHYTYTPDADWNGTETFEFLVDDGQSENHSDIGLVTIVVKPENDAPNAINDIASTDEDTAVSINVLGNDTDSDLPDDTLTIASVTQPENGTTVISAGKILYTPSENYNGTDSFSYTVSDGDGKTDTAAVTITIAAVNDTPSGGDDTATVDEDHSVTIQATVNDDVDETTNPDIEDVTITDIGVVAHGMASITNGGKDILYTPNANWFGTETFTYTATDSGTPALTADFTVIVTVNPVNDAPEIRVTSPLTELPDVTTLEDTETSPITFTVYDEEDAESSLIVTIMRGNTALVPALTVTPGADGSCSFTILPNLNKNGSSTITVTVKDSANATDTDTFTLTVTKVNDDPSAKNDAATTDENHAVTLSVLNNDDVDTGNEGDTLSIVSVTDPQYGTYAISGQTIIYTPNPDRDTKVSYTDTFQYTMTDLVGAINSSANIVVTVTPVNDAPVISEIADITGIAEDAEGGTGLIPFTVTDEEDANSGLVVTAASSNTTLVPVANILITSPSDNPDGSKRNVQVLPAANKFGEATITLTVTDTGPGVKSASESFTITVNSVNDAPANGDDSYTVTEDVEQELFVLGNDDVDGANSLTVTDITTLPTKGTVRIAGDGKSVFYKTALNSNAADSFVYKGHDAYGNTDYEFTVNITVTPVNDAPVITYYGEASYTVNETVAQNGIPFTVTDVDDNCDVDNGELLSVEVTAKSSNSLLLKNGITITAPSGENRELNLQPYLKWNGFTTVTITAKDSGGLTAIKQIPFTVNNVNDPPVAYNDTFTIDEDETTTLNVLYNDRDEELLTNPADEEIFVNTVTNNDPNAVITASADNKSIQIVPLADYNGPVTFTYTIHDKLNAVCATPATVTVNISPVNDAPVPDDETATTAEGTPVTIDVLDGDTDIDQDATLNAAHEPETLSISIAEETLVKAAHGSIEVVDGKIVYTPSGDYNGPDSFEYNCSDGDALVAATVDITVTQVNDNPVAVADTVTTNEDTDSLPVNVLSNDTDVDTNTTYNKALPLHLLSELYVDGTSVSPEASGTVAFTAPGTLVFKPATNWFGTATVTYTLKDGHGGETTGTLTVTVNSVNDLPQFADGPDTMNLTEDEANGVDAFTVSDVETPAGDLLVEYVSSDKESLVDGDCVTLEKGTSGAWTVTVNPKDNQNGSAKITLKVTDGDGGITTIEFTVNVSAVNDNPVAIDKSLTIAEDSNTQTILKSTLVSDVDVDTNNDVLTLTVDPGTIKGTAAVSGGNITYKPLANWNGEESFTYTVTDIDGLTATKTITFTVSQVNDAPEPDADSATTDEGTAVTIDVLDGDTDIDQDGTLNGTPGAEVLSVTLLGGTLTVPAHGSIEVADGKIVYTPTGDYNGTDSFEYFCFDGETQVPATVEVTIKQVNDAPHAVADSAETPDETPVSVNVLSNDTDIDTDGALNKDEQHSKSSFRVTDYYFIDGDSGELSELNGVITYTPELNFVGTQKIGYVLSDGHGLTDIGLLTIAVAAQNDTPVAHDDAMNTEEDKAVTLNVLTNDTDQDPGDTLYFVEFTSSMDNLPGTFNTNANGSVTFTPSANYHGSFTIDYQMRDAGGLTSTATITVTVSAVNDAPTASNGTASTNEDTKKEIDVSALIADADIATDSDVLTITVGETDEPAHGTVTISGKKISYTPDANWNGSDSLTFTATDKAGEAAKAEIDITVVPVNDAPVANADSITIDEDDIDTFDVLSNDTDVDTDDALNTTPQSTPTLSLVGTALHGTVSIEKGRVQYQPAENYNGPDSFTYTITDGTLTSSATVTVTVNQVNDPVVPVNDTATTTDEDPVTIDALSNDTDVDTDTTLNKGTLHLKSEYSITLIGSPSHGTAVLVSGKIVYTPEDTYNGADSFGYTMTDGHGSTASAQVSVTILSKNDPPETPVVSSPKDGDRAGGSSKVKVEWTCFDIDGDTLSYTLEYYDGKGWVVEKTGLTDTTYEFAIPSSVGSTDGLKFRVKAKDSEFTSDYGYSGAMSVDRDAPLSVTVNMKTADGRAYTAGVWTNQTVTVTALSADDLNPVTFQYAQDGAAYAAAANSVVTTGVHSVYILATDAFDNAAEFGPYLARVDKQAPAVPKITESISGANILLTLTFNGDPGGSGNDYLILPDNTRTAAKGTPQYAVSRNGSVSFTLYDVAGNKTTFTYTVASVDTSKPVITCSSGDYSIGSTTQSAISASLSFTDAESELTARGYQLSTSAAPGGSYRNYSGSISISTPGTYYIHAYAKNTFGLTTYETFGPFIVEAVPEATPVPTPTEETGDVLVSIEDIVENVPEPPVYIRLPGEEWSQTLTLEDVGPGDYIVEAMDADGNIYTTTVHVTMRDIIARQLRQAGAGWGIAAVAGGLGLLGLFLILLLIGNNVTIRVFGEAVGEEKKLRTMRHIRFRKDTLIIKLENKHVSGGEYATIHVAKHLTKRMRTRTIVITLRGQEVLSEMIPEDINEAFKRKIEL